MDGLRVLITSFTMAGRTGGVLYVRDLALQLQRLGHHPVVYTPNLGPPVDELRRATIPVVDDPAALGGAPDVIHGNHTLETLTALLQHPGTPAVFVCHGWSSWATMAPRHDRVIRYVAVDDTCRDQLHLVDGVPSDRIDVILNWVDLDRFHPRGPLPEQPERALVFSNQAREDGSHLPAIREACQRLGIPVDVIGYGVSNSVDRPEHILLRYDLVFAKAKAALEALAVGCSVVVCDDRGLASLVTSGEFDRLRRLNFGARTLSSPVDPDSLIREIKRYDAGDAAAVSCRLRAEAGLDTAIDRIVALYRHAITEGATRQSDLAAEGRAVARYLRLINRRLVEHDGLTEVNRVLATDKQSLSAELERLGMDMVSLRSQLDREIDAREAADAELAECRLRADRQDGEIEALGQMFEALSGTTTFRIRRRLLEHPVAGPAVRVVSRLRRRVFRPPAA